MPELAMAIHSKNRIWAEVKRFALFVSSLWGLVGIVTALFPLWSDYLGIFPLPRDFLCVASLMAVIFGIVVFIYEYIERDSLIPGSKRGRKAKNQRYEPDARLMAAFLLVVALLFLIRLTVYERKGAVGERYYITGIVDPILKPEFMRDKQKTVSPLENGELEGYLNSVPEQELPEAIIRIYGRFPVAFSWAALFFLYVFPFMLLSAAFGQLAVREYIRNSATGAASVIAANNGPQQRPLAEPQPAVASTPDAPTETPSSPAITSDSRALPSPPR